MKTQTMQKVRHFFVSSLIGSLRFWILILAGFATGQLNAAPLTYANDFEAYSNVATNLEDLADADPTGAEWNILDDASYNPTNSAAGVQVINWLARSGTNALLLRANTEAQIYLTNPKSVTSYTLDFWVHAIRGDGDRNWYVILRGMGADSNGDDYFAYRTDRATSSNLFYFDGIGPSTAAFIDAGVDHVDNQWQHHRVVFNSASQTCAIYVDDMVTPVVVNGELARPDVAVPSLIILRHEGNSTNDGYCVFDDIRFSMDSNISVTPVALGGGGFQLSWQRTGALKYRVQRGASLNNLVDISGDLLVTQFTDPNPPTGVAFYRVVGHMDLTTPFSDGFESYPSRANPGDDADPLGPWSTVESDGNGSGRPPAPAKVQVVDASVMTPHSGSKCLKIEAGQRAGASIAWGQTPLSDVQITWWARVPEAIQSSPTADANFLRMSLYGVEGSSSYSGDSALLGYGIRRQSNTNTVDGTSLTYFTTAWQDTTADYTPDTWEEYRLTTHNSQGRYTIIKNPSSASPIVVVDRASYIGTAVSWGPTFMAAWSSSNGTNHPPVYIDDIDIRTLVSNPDPLGEPYSITNYGTRFTNWTVLTANAAVGRPIVDPRDNSTILFTTDIAGGGIFRAQKTGNGTWTIDPQAIVSGLDRPSGLAIETNGTIWWTHDFNNDFTRSLARLKWPWSGNTPETVIADIGDINATTRDDDAIDVTVAPTNFTGSVGQPGWIIVADRGADGDANNAVYVVDPATTILDQVNYNNFLVSPTAGDLGGNLNAIASLAGAVGEVVTLSQDAYLVAVDGSGGKRYINALNLWPITTQAAAAAIAVDPLTGKIWAADDLLDEVWSIDSSTAADQREIGFPLTDPLRPDRQIDFHEPGMAFAPNGSFMVLTDASFINGGGGRLIIFHNDGP